MDIEHYPRLSPSTVGIVLIAFVVAISSHRCLVLSYMRWSTLALRWRHRIALVGWTSSSYINGAVIPVDGGHSIRLS